MRKGNWKPNLQSNIKRYGIPTQELEKIKAQRKKAKDLINKIQVRDERSNKSVIIDEYIEKQENNLTIRSQLNELSEKIDRILEDEESIINALVCMAQEIKRIRKK